MEPAARMETIQTRDNLTAPPGNSYSGLGSALRIQGNAIENRIVQDWSDAAPVHHWVAPVAAASGG